MKILCISLLAALHLLNLVNSTWAEQSIFTDASTNFSFNDNQQFLKVTEAYRANLLKTDDNLEIIWDIENSYYLYADKFSLTINNMENQFDIDRKGKWVYDEFFKTDKEVFYNSVSLTAKTPLQDAIIAVGFQGCAELGLCYPPETYYFKMENSNLFPISAEEAALIQPISQPPSPTNAFADVSTISIGLALIFAFLGGIILNLMPCVFPVLSIKALGLVSHNNIKQHGWVYSAGVVICFIAAGLTLIALRYSGTAVGWGFQLQSPYFIAALLVLFFVMGLSLLGLIEVGTSLMGMGQNLTKQQGLRGTFFTGFLSVIVATPCTAPFMTSALGFAVAQPPVIGASIFAALGLGMAFPMWLLTQFPKLIQKLPRSGTWMVHLKQVMSFPMFLTCVWLLWIFANQLTNTAAMMLLAALILLAMAVWMRFVNIKHWLWYAVIIIAIATGYTALSMQSEKIAQHEKFNLKTLDNLVGKDQPVFVDVTANWCITCLVNERALFSNESVQQAFDDANVQVIIADWTNPNPEINTLLQRYNRVGIPLYLWFPANSTQAQILPQILTPLILLNLVENAP